MNLFFPTFPTFLFAICLPRLLDVLDADENELNFAIEMLTPPGSSDAEVQRPHSVYVTNSCFAAPSSDTSSTQCTTRTRCWLRPYPRLGSIVTRIKLGSRSNVATPRAASLLDPPGSRDTPEGALRPRPRPA